MSGQVQALFDCRLIHQANAVMNAVYDHRCFYLGIGGDDVNRLGALFGRQFTQGIPTQLQCCGAILSAGVANDPGVRILPVGLTNCFLNLRQTG